MVGLFVGGWYPSEEKAIMITPLFTMAGSLLTMAFPILMLLSGKHTTFVPWLILVSNLLLGLALFSTFSQRQSPCFASWCTSKRSPLRCIRRFRIC